MTPELDRFIPPLPDTKPVHAPVVAIDTSEMEDKIQEQSKRIQELEQANEREQQRMAAELQEQKKHLAVQEEKLREMYGNIEKQGQAMLAQKQSYSEMVAESHKKAEQRERETEKKWAEHQLQASAQAERHRLEMNAARQAQLALPPVPYSANAAAKGAHGYNAAHAVSGNRDFRPPNSRRGMTPGQAALAAAFIGPALSEGFRMMHTGTNPQNPNPFATDGQAYQVGDGTLRTSTGDQPTASGTEQIIGVGDLGAGASAGEYNGENIYGDDGEGVGGDVGYDFGPEFVCDFGAGY